MTNVLQLFELLYFNFPYLFLATYQVKEIVQCFVRCLQCLDVKVCERSIITNTFSDYRLYNTMYWTKLCPTIV